MPNYSSTTRRYSLLGTIIGFVRCGAVTVDGFIGYEATKEELGKRNLPGKPARRHFSQLSEFERGLIIGMKTAGWSTRRVAGQVDRSECAIRNCWVQ
ncbi:uncharacterized protein TNCV_975951 [Trichonephila clavipes]|nr:uncharacterized protein TNCV_975951 [Trichonephila clavipes]